MFQEWRLAWSRMANLYLTRAETWKSEMTRAVEFLSLGLLSTALFGSGGKQAANPTPWQPPTPPPSLVPLSYADLFSTESPATPSDDSAFAPPDNAVATRSCATT